MWMVKPELMCNKHLIGEHGELHKFLNSWKKKFSIDGRIKGNAIEPLSYKNRHDVLVEEMIRRDMNHKSPLKQPNFNYLPIKQINFKVNVNKNYKELVSRCNNCKNRMI